MPYSNNLLYLLPFAESCSKGFSRIYSILGKQLLTFAELEIGNTLGSSGINSKELNCPS